MSDFSLEPSTIAIGAAVCIAWYLLALLGGYIAKEKGREYREGFLMGLALGFFGVLLAALMPTKGGRR